MCQEGGGVLVDVLGYRLEDGWGLVVNASNRRKIFSWLLQHRENLDADLHDQTDATAMAASQGPRAIFWAGKILRMILQRCHITGAFLPFWKDRLFW